MAGEEFSGFHVRLQTLRGLAALAVAVGHSLLIVDYLQVHMGEPVRRSNALPFLLQLIFQADTAVVFFFVLSGFVLGQSVRAVRSEHPAETLGAFALKRFGRLLPLYWLSIALVFGYLALGWRQPHPMASYWFNMLFPKPVTAELLGANVVSLDTTVNPVLWSIQVELVMIPFVPLLAWLASRYSLKINTAVILLTVLVTCLDVLPRCLSYVFCFHLGVLLPSIARQPVLRRWLSHRATVRAALLYLFLVEAIHRLDYMPFSEKVNHDLKYLLDSALSLAIIANTLLRPDIRAMRVLDFRPLVALGTLSYGFYAFHLATMDVFAQLWLKGSLGWPNTLAAGTLGLTGLSLLVALLSSITAVAVAMVAYRLAEVPGIRLGRLLAAKIAGNARPGERSAGDAWERARAATTADERSYGKYGLAFRAAAFSIAVLGVLAVAVGAEFIARQWIFDPTKYYLRLPGWEKVFVPTPGGTPGIDVPARVVINSLGIRGDMPTFASSPRIVVLGGSTVEDLMLNNPDTWSGRLQSMLQLEFPRAWAGNMGKSGTTSVHHALAIERILPAFPRVNVVVVLVGLNDMLRDFGMHQPPALPPDLDMLQTFEYAPGENPSRCEQIALCVLLERSQNSKRMKVEREVDLGKTMESYKQRYRKVAAEDFMTRVPEMKTELARYRQTLARIHDDIQRQGAQLVFVTQPYLWKREMNERERSLLYAGGLDSHEHWFVDPRTKFYSPLALKGMLDRYNDVVRSFCRERSLVCVDLEREMPKDASLFFDDFHFTRIGADRVAAIVAPHVSNVVRTRSAVKWGR